MAAPLGTCRAAVAAEPCTGCPQADRLRSAKKKGCKKKKCSNWKGGKCRCGRD